MSIGCVYTYEICTPQSLRSVSSPHLLQPVRRALLRQRTPVTPAPADPQPCTAPPLCSGLYSPLTRPAGVPCGACRRPESTSWRQSLRSATARLQTSTQSASRPAGASRSGRQRSRSAGCLRRAKFSNAYPPPPCALTWLPRSDGGRTVSVLCCSPAPHSTMRRYAVGPAGRREASGRDHYEAGGGGGAAGDADQRARGTLSRLRSASALGGSAPGARAGSCLILSRLQKNYSLRMAPRAADRGLR